MSSLLNDNWLATAAATTALVIGACSAKSSAPPTSSQAGTSPVLGAAGAMVGAGGTGSVGTGPGAGGSSPIAGSSSVITGAGGVVGGAGTSAGVAGAGGAATTKLCATKVTAASTQIANFENFNGTSTVDMYGFAFGGPTNGTAGVYSGAYGYAGGTDAVLLAILAGHTGNYGLTESTTPATSWGQGLGFWMGCVNASAYKGITFWVRGVVPSGVFSFGLNLENTTLPDATNAAAGGTCTGTTDTCKPPTKSAIAIGMDWTQVSVPWADLTGGLNGATPVVATGDNITGFTLLMALNYAASTVVDGGYDPVPGNISFAIDDIAFMP